jgi:hypothetical protein
MAKNILIDPEFMNKPRASSLKGCKSVDIIAIRHHTVEAG